MKNIKTTPNEVVDRSAVPVLKRGQRRWTEEQRAELARRIRARKPWLKSTGPKTVSGKRRSSMNAFKHGHKSRRTLAFRGILRRHRSFLAKLAIYRRAWWKEQKKLEIQQRKADFVGLFKQAGNIDIIKMRC